MKKRLVILTLCASLLSINAAACNTDKTPSDAGTQTVTEAQNETETSQAASEANDADFNSAAYLDFAKCMDAIYNVQAGSAGASLRAENAVDEIKNYMSEHPDNINDEDLSQFITMWQSVQSLDAQTLKADFNECLATTIDVADETDSALDSDENFTKIINALKDAMK